MFWERWPRILPLRLRSLFHRTRVEAELEEELQDHIDHLTREFLERGLPPSEAKIAAVRRFGGVARHKEECRDARGLNLLEQLLRDIRYGGRALLHQPGFTLVALVTLALGIGATTAMFTVVAHVLLRPLGYRDADRLVVVQYQRSGTVAAANFLDFQSQSRSFEGMGAAEWWSPNLSLADRPEELDGLRVTPEIFPLLGVAPLLGRTFTPEEASPGGPRVVILSYQLWHSHFAGDSSVIHRRLTIDGESHEVIGVMPPGFVFAPYWATGARLWTPLPLDQRATDRTGASLRVFARLRPDVPLDAARREIAALAARLNQEYPGTNPGGTLIPLKDLVVGDVREPLRALFAAVGLVLLIACTNVAHLQLLRAAARQREFALRGALGAARGRLLQQSLIESLLLSLAGGAAGLLLAWGGLRLLRRFGPTNLPRLDSIAIDPPIVAFVLAVSLGATLLFGLAPALTAAGADLHAPLKEGSRGTADSPRRRRFRALLVASEFALALMLLVGAGLVLRSFIARQRLDPGFRAEGVLSAVVSLRGTAHADPARRGGFYRDLLASVRALEGVTEASLINHLPLHGDNWPFPYAIEGRALAAPASAPRALFRIVQPGFFSALGIPLLAGRDFTDDDLSSRARVVIVNQAMARREWPGANPLGRRLSVDDPAKGADWFTVIGVVGDSRQAGWISDVRGEMYFPHLALLAPADLPGWQGSLVSFLNPSRMTLVIHSRRDSGRLLGEIRAAVGRLDPGAPVSDVLTLKAAVAEQFAEPRFELSLFAGFALLALILAAVGIYGVMSYSVARRSHEIGIRLALGANRGDAFRLVVRQGMRLALAGSLAGLAGALILARYLRSMLFGVDPSDPLTLAGVTLLLALVALLAAAVPARRAARVNPLVALRSD
jgi:putative ABC transport system permease protein